MAQVYLKANKIAAQHADVQDELETRAFEVGVRAEQILIEHRQDGHAEIDVEHGDIDYYVVLSDERGQKAALSIEYGREAGEDIRVNPRTGQLEVVEWAAMEGLYVLARASHLPKKRKGKVKLD
ncbi:tail completion or Neck1 protein [Streptomyces phage Pablito]|uniref:Uncharacterized protein n=1 Tax=Streptomyces phage Pablito TaxID=2894593 RepID=A0AAE8YF82_9CAUD|nr:tail completion or Neck1 protein [Streptomyces phage Pablito]UFD97951.1 hypothetical protein [Streptomyces phage Pablito]